MAYKLHYEIKFDRNDGMEETPKIVGYLRPACIFATDADYEAQMAFAQAEAYGEITVEEVPDEVTEPTEMEQLRADVDYIAMETGVEL